MREIVLDTETTGLDPNEGHRLVEIGCIELFNRIPTGEHFHVYINPEREVPQEAVEIHGLTTEFLRDKPTFAEVAEAFVAFLGEDTLVIHNAPFDMKFLNAELTRLQRPRLERNAVVDTLAMARRKHPGSPVSLDALCQRYQIDNSRRTYHGALLDCELLAEVYIDLLGVREPGLSFDALPSRRKAEETQSRPASTGRRPTPLPSRLGASEREAHRAFIAELGEKALWREFLTEG